MRAKHLSRAFRYCRQHRFSRDEVRNLRLGAVVSLYGISFAVEKLLSTVGMPLHDRWWLLIYGVFAAVATYWWVEDAVLDIWEQHTDEDDLLYQNEDRLRQPE